MDFSNFDNSKSSLPGPKLNGGLYTGQPFQGNWGNVPVKPDTVYLNNQNLRSANPPNEALVQYGDIIRPGNSVPEFVNIHKFSDKHNIVCTGSYAKDGYKSNDPTFANEMLY
jgi:hypothetical protein